MTRTPKSGGYRSPWAIKKVAKRFADQVLPSFPVFTWVELDSTRFWLFFFVRFNQISDGSCCFFGSCLTLSEDLGRFLVSRSFGFLCEQDFSRRLLLEAEILRTLSHPNIVGYRALTKAADGTWCLAMEKAETSLMDLIEQRLDQELGPFEPVQVPLPPPLPLPHLVFFSQSKNSFETDDRCVGWAWPRRGPSTTCTWRSCCCTATWRAPTCSSLATSRASSSATLAWPCRWWPPTAPSGPATTTSAPRWPLSSFHLILSVISRRTHSNDNGTAYCLMLTTSSVEVVVDEFSWKQIGHISHGTKPDLACFCNADGTGLVGARGARRRRAGVGVGVGRRHQPRRRLRLRPHRLGDAQPLPAPRRASRLLWRRRRRRRRRTRFWRGRYWSFCCGFFYLHHFVSDFIRF